MGARVMTLCGVLGFLSVVVGCGGGGSSNKQPALPAPTVVSLVVASSTASQPLGLNQQFTATANLSDGTNRDVTFIAAWTSSDSNIATVGSTGLVSTKSTGSVIIRALYNNVTGTSQFRVDPAAPTSIAVSAANSSNPLGLAEKFSASASFTDGVTRNVTSTATWVSTDPTIATVDASGLVTTRAIGSVTIKATLGPVNDSKYFSVTPPELVSITLTTDSLRFLIASDHQLVVTGMYTDNSTRDLSSSSTFQLTNPYPVKFNQSQQLTAVAEGLTTITAAYAGFSSSIEVQSYSKPRFGFVPDSSRVNSYVHDTSGILRATTYVVLPSLQDSCVTPSTDRSFVVVSNYRSYPPTGMTSGFLSIFRVDAVTGELSLVRNLPVPAVNGVGLYSPGCAVFHPSGAYFYVADEESGSVTGYSFDARTGDALELPSSPVIAGAKPSAQTMDPLGRFLYVSNSASSDISVFAVDVNTGALAPVAGGPIQGFQGMNDVAIDPRGIFAIVTARNSNQLSVYKIQSTGLLTYVRGSNRTVLNGVLPAVFSPTGTFIYLSGLTRDPNSSGYEVETDSFDPVTGLTTKISSISLKDAYNLPVIDPEGKHLYISAPDGFQLFFIQPDGTLQFGDRFRAAVAANTFTPLAFIGSTTTARFSTAYVYAASPGTNEIAEFSFSSGQLELLGRLNVAAPVGSIASDFYGRYLLATAPRTLQPNIFQFLGNIDGSLTPTVSPFSFLPHVPDLIKTDRNGEFVYVSDSFAPEKLHSFYRNNGLLLGTPSEPTISYTSSIALDPAGRFVFVANRDDNSISGFQLKPTDGGFSGNNFAANAYPTGSLPIDVHCEALGRFVYSANSGNGSISAFRIGVAIGADTLIPIGTYSVAETPTVLVSDPFGRFLFVGTAAGDVITYAIDGRTGAIASVTPGATAGSPVRALLTDASGKFLITATDAGVFVFSIQPGGTLNSVMQSNGPFAGSFRSLSGATKVQ